MKSRIAGLSEARVEWRRIEDFIRRGTRIIAALAFLCAFYSCQSNDTGLPGQAGPEGQPGLPSGSSPPVDIPLPITNLMTVSGPDSFGNVRVTGAPGAVLQKALVEVSDLNQDGNAAMLKFDSVKDVEIGANADGSFQITLQAKIGDTLRVVQVVNGNSSPPVDLVVSGKILSLDVIPKDLRLSDSLNQALFTGSKDDQGEVLSLDLDPLPGSFPEVIVQLPHFSGITDFVATAGQGLAISPSDAGLYSFPLDGSEAPVLTPMWMPLKIVVDSDKELAVIGKGGSPSLVLYDFNENRITCSIDLPDPADPGLASSQIPELALIQPSLGPQVRLIVLSQFADGSWMLRKIRIDATNCSHFEGLDIPLTQDIQPGDMAVASDGNVAWLSDSAGDRVLRIDLVNSQVQEISVGKAPLGLALEEDLNVLWVVNQGNNSVTVVNTSDFTTRTRSGIGLTPTRIVLDPAHSRALVLSLFDQSLDLIDLAF